MDLHCSACKSVKPADEFYRSSKYKNRLSKRAIKKPNPRDYRTSECKVCSYKRTKQWIHDHPEQVQGYIRRSRKKRAAAGEGGYQTSLSRAKKRGARITLTLAEWQEVYFGTECHWCGGALHRSFTHVDHIVPLADGGEHSRSNLVTACANCNMRRKWERHTKHWRDT